MVVTMIINAVMPFSALATAWLSPMVGQKMDRQYTKDPYITKKTGMQQYKDLFGSSEGYVLHVKYSAILNTVFVTMMYGVGLPILFPIAALCCFNYWICERIICAYYVKLPPSLDQKLTENFLAKVKWAPLFLLFNGYWMVSNK